jgi:hypothetical protein
MLPLFGSWCSVAGTQVVMADSGQDASAGQLDAAIVSTNPAPSDDTHTEEIEAQIRVTGS